jgi:hypothetical protein
MKPWTKGPEAQSSAYQLFVIGAESNLRSRVARGVLSSATSQAKINFNRVFFKYEPPRPLKEIDKGCSAVKDLFARKGAKAGPPRLGPYDLRRLPSQDASPLPRQPCHLTSPTG